MRALINEKLLIDDVAKPQRRPFEIYDTRLSGFTLRIQPSGTRSYYARFGRSRRFALGAASELNPDDARDRCQKLLNNIAYGRHPLEGLSGTAGPTLGQFISDTYSPWVTVNRPRTAANTLDKLQRLFGMWFPEPLSAITVQRIELWKGRRLNSGRKATTVIRDLYTLSSVLKRAVRVGVLSSNAIRTVDKPRIDRRGKIRFLDNSEESRLRTALRDRDIDAHRRCEATNARRCRRQQESLPSLPHFADHLTPAVLLSMNTGLRMGETRKLRWSSIDFIRRWLTVEGGNAKSRQTRHVPLNDEAMNVLTLWREQAGAAGRAFDVSTCFKTA